MIVGVLADRDLTLHAASLCYRLRLTAQAARAIAWERLTLAGFGGACVPPLRIHPCHAAPCVGKVRVQQGAIDIE